MPCSPSPACASRACRAPPGCAWRCSTASTAVRSRWSCPTAYACAPATARSSRTCACATTPSSTRCSRAAISALARPGWTACGRPRTSPACCACSRPTVARLQGAIYGRLFRLLSHRLQHLLRANTRSGSRRNIEAHYDLGNDFYALWLDPTMTYSAAVFASPDESLAHAQLRKYRRILGELGVQPGQTILEVGCGWGGFAEVAATEFGCKVLGITLSPSQLDFARARAERGGFADRVDFELCDYRDVRGQYDHIGLDRDDRGGGRALLADLLRPALGLAETGRALRGAGDHDRRRAVRTLPPRHRLHPAPRLPQRHAAQPGRGRAAGGARRARGGGRLRLRARLRAHAGALAPQLRRAVGGGARPGLPERFLRMWRFYLAYCEAGFDTGDIDVHHYVFAHAGAAWPAG